MTAEVYWIGKLVVIEWTLADLAGDPVTTATVAGTITLPDETTASATISQDGATYRASYDPTTAGTHAYRLTASGTADSAEEGTFEVRASPTVGPAPTLDTSTDIGKIRVLIADRDPTNLLLTDAEVEVYLDLARGSGTPKLKRAAASALEAIATSEALVGKVLRTQDLSTDAAKLAAELRAQAANLRGQADDDEENDPDDGGAFYIVEFVPPFSRRAGELAEEA
jgi:hypothetical protein